MTDPMTDEEIARFRERHYEKPLLPPYCMAGCGEYPCPTARAIDTLLARNADLETRLHEALGCSDTWGHGNCPKCAREAGVGA